MSRCIDCLEPMSDCEARHSYICHACRKKHSQRSGRVIPTAYTERNANTGRRCRNLKKFGIAPDMRTTENDGADSGSWFDSEGRRWNGERF